MSTIVNVLLSLLLCLSLPVEGMAEDASVQAHDVLTEEKDSFSDVAQSESAPDGEDCSNEAGPCFTLGSEAESLPPSGSLPLQELDNSVEEGEEQFGGCATGTLPHCSLGILLALLFTLQINWRRRVV